MLFLSKAAALQKGSSFLDVVTLIEFGANRIVCPGTCRSGRTKTARLDLFCMDPWDEIPYNGMKALTLKKVRFQILFHGDGGKYEKLKNHPSKTGHYIFNL